MQPSNNVFQRIAGNEIDINAIPINWFIGAHRTAASDAKNSVLSPLHKALNAEFVTLEDVQWVMRYGNIYREYAAIKTAAGMLDVSVMTHIELTGEHAALAVQHFFSNDIINAANGVMRYGALVDEQGKVIDDCIAYKFSNAKIWLIANFAGLSSLPNGIIEQWDAYSSTLQYRDLGTAFVKIQVQGPQSPRVIGTVFPAISADQLHAFEFTTDSATDSVIGRCGYSGEDGFEIFVPQALGAALWNRLQQAGALSYGIAAIEYCRVESGLISLNDYISGHYYPQEIGLGDFVKASTEPYLHAYRRIVSAVPTITQWYVLFDQFLPRGDLHWEDAPCNGSTLRTSAGQCGMITSLVYSPLFKRFAGLATFPYEAVQEGDEVKADEWKAKITTVKNIRLMKKTAHLDLPVDVKHG